MLKTAIKIATRKSPLALWQTHFVIQSLQQKFPHLSFEIIAQTTEGDKIQDKPLTEIGGKDLFVKDLQQKILQNKADMAVHSCKDMSVFEPDELVIAAFCQRQDPRDAFLSQQYSTLLELPQGAKVGTSSPRRQCQLKAIRPDLLILPLRGNVGTRVTKLENGEYDAIILAAAGLQRLNLSHLIKEYFDPHYFIPAIGQGVIAVECHRENVELITILKTIDHADTRIAVTAERAVNQKLGGDCYTPLGVHAYSENNQLILNGMMGSLDGENIIRGEARGNLEDAENLGFQLAEKMLQGGAKN